MILTGKPYGTLGDELYSTRYTNQYLTATTCAWATLDYALTTHEITVSPETSYCFVSGNRSRLLWVDSEGDPLVCEDGPVSSTFYAKSPADAAGVFFYHNYGLGFTPSVKQLTPIIGTRVVSKAVGFAVLGSEVNILVSKAVAYAVLEEGEEPGPEGGARPFIFIF